MLDVADTTTGMPSLPHEVSVELGEEEDSDSR
jgi:hypothetical protein